MWIWFAATFAGLLGVSFGRTMRSMRRRQRARAQLPPVAHEWRQRTIDVTINGNGEIPIATVLDRTNGLTVAFDLLTTEGVMLQVPAGLVLEVATQLKVIDGRYVASAQTPFSLYVSTAIANDGPMRTLGRIDERARLVLHARGWNLALELNRNLELRWRAGRLASAIAIPAGIVMLIATNPIWMGVGLAAVAALAFDAIFLRSSLLALYATRPSHRALAE